LFIYWNVIYLKDVLAFPVSDVVRESGSALKSDWSFYFRDFDSDAKHHDSVSNPLDSYSQ